MKQKDLKHNTAIVNSKINTSVNIYKAMNFNAIVNITLKKEYTIISIEELEKLKKAEHALKDLQGSIQTLRNKLKTLSDDIRTISES